MSTISIIGTGGMAAAIGSLAAKAGHSVEVIGRDAAKAQALAKLFGAEVAVGSLGAVPAGEIVILAVPYSAVLDVTKQYGQALAGKTLVDGAREIAKVAPSDADVVKAFNTQFSHVLAAGPRNGLPLDVFLAGDAAPAKARVSAFVESLGMRPLDVGSLQMAKTLEHVCLLSLGLMTHALEHTDFAIGVSLFR